MKKLNIGILGCGGVAERWYLKGLTGQKDKYDLVAVADINYLKAKNAALKYNIQKTYRSLKELSTHPNLDLIVVLTGHKDHYENIRYCLNHKLHVYSEKPFAPNYKKGLELIKLAKKRNLYLGSAPQIMLSSRNKKVKEIITSGTLGKITFVRASSSNMGPADRKGVSYDPRWFYNDGGSLKSLGIYGLADVLWWLGKPKRVAGLSGISIPNRTVMYGPLAGKKFTVKSPDNEVALLEFKNETYVLFDGSYSVLTPPQYEFEIHGTKASLFVGGFGGKNSIFIQEREKTLVPIGPEDTCHLDWNLSWGVEETIAAILEKRETLTNPEFALLTIQVIDAIQSSSKTGKYVKI